MTKLLRSLAALLLFAFGATAFAQSVVISQVYGGGGNTSAPLKNDFIEIFNAGSQAVSLAGFTVQYAAATGSSWQVTNLSGTLQPGQYYLIQEAVGANTSAASLPTPDATGGIPMSATAGKVALVDSTTALTTANPLTGPAASSVLDIVSFGAATPTEGSPTPTLANTTAALRNAQGCTDTNSNNADFTVGAPNPRNTASPINVCGANKPIVTSCPAFTVPAGLGGSGIDTASDFDDTVNGVTLSNQSVGVSLGTLTPATGPNTTASVPVIVDPSITAATTLGYQLNWTNNNGQSAICTGSINVVVLPVVAIHDIQGPGATSPLAGQTVVTTGVVTRTTNTGFYMQTPDAQIDADPNTSEGISVFLNKAPTVQVGDLVRVAATVSEFNTGATTNTDTASHTITELSTIVSQTVLSSNNALPTPIQIAFPLANRDDLEKYEHMLVTLTGPFTVEQNFFVGRFGQVTVAAGGRVETPTNRLRPGPAALALYADNKRRSIVIEDGTTAQDPNPIPYFEPVINTIRAGDTTPSITGIVDYGLVTDSNLDPGSWRIVQTVMPVFTNTNARTTAPDDVGGTLRIASGNVENFFTTFTDGTTFSGQTGQGCALGSGSSAGNCRGADNLTEFNRQLAKITAEIVGLNPDVMGIMELQNNRTSDAGGGSIGTLVASLNAAVGSPTWAYVPDPPFSGTDAIKVGMIYKPSKVTLVGTAKSDTNTIHNRAPMAQTFSVTGTGQQFTLVVNHLRSKSCPGTGADADAGDLQSCFNGTRVQQAQATQTWIGTLGLGINPNLVLVGDFNAYAMEDPIVSFTSNGYVDEIARFNTFGYSFQFDGSSGRLDHMLTSPTMSAKVKRAIEWHINADEPSVLDYNLEFKQPCAAGAACNPDFYTPTPYRASDHDPIIMGVTFPPPVAAPPRR